MFIHLVLFIHVDPSPLSNQLPTKTDGHVAQEPAPVAFEAVLAGVLGVGRRPKALSYPKGAWPLPGSNKVPR